MNSYIEDRRREGALDSEGVFTVDSLAALRITLASALPEPHYYLFGIVQGLLAGGAQEIEIAIGRRATRFHFLDAQEVFADLEAFQSRLTQGLTLSSSRPRDLLLAGMATSVGMAMESATLFAPDGGSAFRLSLEEAKVMEVTPPESGAKRTLLELRRSSEQGMSFAFTRVWGARAEEGELQQRFEFASPPLKIAGLTTSPRSEWRKSVASAGVAGPVVLLEAAVFGSPSRDNHRAPQFHPMVTLDAEAARQEIPVALNSAQSFADFAHKLYRHGSVARCLFRRAFDENGQALECTLGGQEWEERLWTFYLTSGLDLEAEISWIRNGMTVETTRYDLGMPGLIVLAPAAGLDVDASGYALVRNESFQERLKTAEILLDKVRSTLFLEDVETLYERLATFPTVDGPTPQQEIADLLRAFAWL